MSQEKKPEPHGSTFGLDRVTVKAEDFSFVFGVGFSFFSSEAGTLLRHARSFSRKDTALDVVAKLRKMADAIEKGANDPTPPWAEQP